MRSQLKQTSLDKNGSPYRNAEYIYRKDGNLNYRIINDSRTNFTYSGDLMVEATGAAGFDLDWDDNGNMTTGVSETFTYNWDNKLRSASALLPNIKYDPSGNRVRKQSVAVGDRKYIVDIVGNLPTTLMEMTDNTILKTYIYANGQPLCQNDGDYSAPRYFYIHDRLGSVRQIMDTAGNVVNYYTYEPFGETIEQTSDGSLATGDGFMFTGQYFDTEIDQYYLRARQYDPHISRFTARDPVRGRFEEPLTLHVYLHCINDPINKIDPTGEWAAVLGGSLSGNLGPSFIMESMTKSFGMIGYSLGLSALVQAEAGIGGTVGAGFAFAHDPDKGLTKGWSYGFIRWAAGGLSAASGSGYSITADFAISPEAKRVTDLRGHFEEAGGSVSFEVPGRLRWLTKSFWNASVGFTASRSVDEHGNPTGTHLYTLSPGTGLAGWEVHAYRGYTWVDEWGHN